jgi:hypothetical protein
LYRRLFFINMWMEIFEAACPNILNTLTKKVL